MRNDMKKSILYLCAASLLAVACAKAPSTGLNDAAKRSFDAWIQVFYPNAEKSAPGYYVVEDQPGTGAAAGDENTSPYVLVDYVIRTQNGTVQETLQEDLSKQIGSYDATYYYGPSVWARGSGKLNAGVDAALNTMRVGGFKRFIIPGWLQTNKRYDSEEEYLANISGTSAIYEVKLLSVIPDIKKWETDSVGRYVSRHFPGKSVLDSLKYGFYYFRTKEPSSTIDFPADTTIYINYVGRLLNGLVFDTNIKDSAKYYGLYSDTKTYTPSTINWPSSDGKYSDIKMGSSTMIDGFSYALSKMHPHEKGVAVFYSDLGYGTSGSGKSIPAYSPLRFDIEIVNKP